MHLFKDIFCVQSLVLFLPINYIVLVWPRTHQLQKAMRYNYWTSQLHDINTEEWHAISWKCMHGFHDVVIKWKRQRHWPFLRGIHRSPVNSLHNSQWGGALMFPLICAWTNVWAKNQDAVDLSHYRAHFDAIVMLLYIIQELMFDKALQIESAFTVTNSYFSKLRVPPLSILYLYFDNISLFSYWYLYLLPWWYVYI